MMLPSATSRASGNTYRSMNWSRFHSHPLTRSPSDPVARAALRLTSQWFIISPPGVSLSNARLK